ncbi:phosphatidylinositol 3,4,5-trisphosphate 3-phosphatase and dual-specificity protein phosphatase PTEN-like isoform X2 [Anthonomus grandis grandis]|uniref:phosphatidylinositol 3,4,5-trisphosphate 3-phosphatase and dual-specificity protein phosphatase PTEN-like isoform X2 n=1 Tax=Anthonomus grandis grandis TaxID=2921223 RepID=UPI0021652111|nr:phosphatidylinositol 3,4,5-trisphosphate 3-phosphatase and dual-specificity protein phosphatase PTEN-like isoform X2 [Anthonomus grandis grandis]
MGVCVSCRKSKNKTYRGNCTSLNKNNPKEFIGFLPSTKTAKGTTPLDKNDSREESSCLNRQSMDSQSTLETMTASFPNMNFTNPIKNIVSKKRNRYKQDGFNLDLTYITDSIIAMGYPASNIESVYRNNIEDVVKFLDQKHPKHYMIYNLCSERSYDKAKFHNMVKDFPFDDHSPPMIESVEPFCQNVQDWLDKDSKNVVVVHCKAGKGRTGTMICCYLLHSKKCHTAQQALELYGDKRTQDTKGVTIPSQVRYVNYYEQLVNKRVHYVPTTLYIKEFIFEPVPTFIGGPGNLSFTVSESFPGEKLTQKYKSEPHKIPLNNSQQQQEQLGQFSIKLDRCFALSGDVKIEFYNKIMIRRKEKLFHFWFNTFFVSGSTATAAKEVKNGFGTDGEGGCYHMTFRKNELDKLNKRDKQHKIFSENFKLTMVVQIIATRKEKKEAAPPAVRTHPPPDTTTTTPCGSSAGSSDEEDEDDESDEEEEEDEDEDDDDEDWESAAERFDPKGVGYRILSECELASQVTSSSGDQSETLMAT